MFKVYNGLVNQRGRIDTLPLPTIGAVGGTAHAGHDNWKTIISPVVFSSTSPTAPSVYAQRRVVATIPMQLQGDLFNDQGYSLPAPPAQINYGFANTVSQPAVADFKRPKTITYDSDTTDTADTRRSSKSTPEEKARAKIISQRSDEFLQKQSIPTLTSYLKLLKRVGGHFKLVKKLFYLISQATGQHPD